MNRKRFLCISLAAVISLSSLSGCSTNDGSYEDLIKQLQDSYQNQDYELFAKVFVTEGMFDYFENDKDMDRDDVMDEIEDRLDIEINRWTSFCGDDLEITIEVKEASKIKHEISDLEELYSDEYNENINIKEAYELECSIVIEGDRDIAKEKTEYIAVNIDGQGWKIVGSALSEEKIESADQTAASIRKTITYTISAMETKGCTLKGSGTFVITDITNSDGASAVFTFGTVMDSEDNSTPLATLGKKVTGDSWSLDDMKDAFKTDLEKDLREIQAGTAIIVIKNGVCTQVAYSSGDIISITEVTPHTFAESGKDGVINGDFVGTNPKVTKDGYTEEY